MDKHEVLILIRNYIRYVSVLALLVTGNFLLCDFLLTHFCSAKSGSLVWFGAQALSLAVLILLMVKGVIVIYWKY